MAFFGGQWVFNGQIGCFNGKKNWFRPRRFNLMIINISVDIEFGIADYVVIAITN